MDTVGEEKALGIHQEALVLGAGGIDSFRFQDGLHGVTNPQVVPAVLVPEDVPPVFGCLAEMVGVFFLPEGEVFPAGNPVAHHLQVCKGINRVLEVL